MSQQQLDYAAVSQPRLPLWQRVVVALALMIGSIGMTPLATNAAWASAGAGEGDYFWFRVLFPGPTLVGIAKHNLYGFVETLMRFQFPAYAIFLSLCILISCRWFLVGTIALIALHSIGAWIA